MWYKVQWGYFMHIFLIFFFILAKQCSKEDCTCIKKSSLCRVGLGHFFLCLLSALFHNYPRRRVCITWLPSKALQFCYLSKIKSLPIPWNYLGARSEKAPVTGKMGAAVTEAPGLQDILKGSLGYLPRLCGLREGPGLLALSRWTKEVLWCSAMALCGLTCSMQSWMPHHIWLQSMHSSVHAGSNHMIMLMHAKKLKQNKISVSS